MVLRVLRLLVRLGWPLRLVSPLFGRYNPFLASALEDPYPQYRALRESAPIYHHPLFRAWILTRHADITSVLKDDRFSVNRTRESEMPRFLDPFDSLSGPFKEAIGSALLMVDPPDHTRLRNLVNKAFTSRRVEALRPRIQSIVDGLCDEMEAGGDVDLVRDFAVPLPVTVIAELLGVPPGTESSSSSGRRYWGDCSTSCPANTSSLTWSACSRTCPATSSDSSRSGAGSPGTI